MINSVHSGLLILFAIVLSLNKAFAQGENNSQQSNLELSRIQVIPIKDSQADIQYELYVKLPEGYAENDSVLFPVIYYTDALWHVEMLSGSAEYIMEEAILVGISWQKDIDPALIEEHGEHVSRFRDYTVLPHSNPEIQAKYQLGQASNHLDFIRKDVIPYVEDNYETDPENRTYFGYSASGLFGAYILSARPETFKNYLIGSPSLRGNISYLSELIADKRLDVNVFITNGTEETELNGLVKEFVSIMENQDGGSLHITHEEPIGNHQSAFPRMAVRSVGWLAEINDISVLKGPYLGQKPPSLTPGVFAPEIIRNATSISFSPELDEVYFSAAEKDEEMAIYFSKLKDNKWTPVRKANFTNGLKREELYPFVGLNDRRIYFTAFDSILSDEKIWFVNRQADSWGEARPLDSPINEDQVFYINQSNNGDLFYTSISKAKMYTAPSINGQFPEVKEVEIEFGHHGFVSPSQDYMLVYTRKEEGDKRADRDIYVCFKKQDGTWTKPINLGEPVNTNLDEGSPSISPDGKYMFFERAGNLYWVSTEVIQRLRPDELNKPEFPKLTGPLMGQQPPGMVAEPFAPGIISKEGWEIEGVFAPGMKEFYFTTRKAKGSPITVIGFRQQDNEWTKYTEFKRQGEVSFSPDGSRMHMADGYKDRVGDGWTERQSLGNMFDREDWGIMRLTASSKGTYVFDDYKSGDVIRISRLKDGKRQPPEEMSPIVNSGKWTAHPFIAPDESYLIWDSEREGGFGDSDLYISFKQNDGSWGRAINMGEAVNTDKWEAFANVTSDGKYITFNRRIDDGSDDDKMNIDIYWVDAQIIDQLRTKQ